jgi:hypothetical protein
LNKNNNLHSTIKMKNIFFKICPKTGKIRSFRTDSITSKLLFPVIGIVALIWVIVRVFPKPSRVSYPCQQTAIPIAAAFLTWIGVTSAGVMFLKSSRKYFKLKRIWISSLLAISGIVLFLGAQFLNNNPLNAQKTNVLQPPSDKPNQPIGDAKGIFPGRVTWVRDINATPWDGKTGNWWEEGNINEDALANMYSQSLQSLTGTSTDRKAWEKIFKYFNRKQGKGNRGWKPGELIAVKININNTYNPNDNDNNIDQSPQATRALLRQLTGPAGIAQKDILIYDASVGWKVRAIPDHIYQPLHKEFPNVRWMDGQGSSGKESPEWQAKAISYTSPEVELGNELPKAVVEASYLINIALLKGHEITGVTLCAKNHFGSIRYPQKDHNKYVSQMNGTRGDYSAYVDLMGSPNLGGKTLLYIVDGLYGMQTNVGDPQERDRWRRLFNGEWSASYFMSLDPVAIESVCLDFLYAEFQQELGYSGAKAFPKGSSRNCDNYLIEAANGINSKYGPYKPNGEVIGSLGVYEHWNNAKEKKYSRNLGTRKGIELIQVNISK